MEEKRLIERSFNSTKQTCSKSKIQAQNNSDKLHAKDQQTEQAAKVD
jgi:hypothetical protein